MQSVILCIKSCKQRLRIKSCRCVERGGSLGGSEQFGPPSLSRPGGEKRAESRGVKTVSEVANIVTTSKALVTRSDALVSTSFLFQNFSEVKNNCFFLFRKNHRRTKWRCS